MIPKTVSSALIIIPVYNEALNLPVLLKNIVEETGCDIVVVDDNSSDQSRDVALEYVGISVLPLPRRLGAWGAIQTGIRFGLERGYNTFITMDGDGQHHPRYIASLLNTMADSSSDMVVGSCPERGSMARHAAWWMFRLLSGINLKDPTSGFKVFNRKTACYLSLPEASIFDYQDMGVILYLLQKNIVIGEKSIHMGPRGDGKSRIFSSWLQVIRYILQTTVLCLSARILFIGLFYKNKGHHQSR